MMDREKAKHIDAFKYWCETNEENGVITIPKFLCDHIIEILDDTNERPHGEWIMHKNFDGYLRFYECSNCNHTQGYLTDFCDTCGADMRKRGDAE